MYNQKIRCIYIHLKQACFVVGLFRPAYLRPTCTYDVFTPLCHLFACVNKVACRTEPSMCERITTKKTAPTRKNQSSLLKQKCGVKLTSLYNGLG